MTEKQNLVTCLSCGFTYCPQSTKDVEQHKQKHDEFLWQVLRPFADHPATYRPTSSRSLKSQK